MVIILLFNSQPRRGCLEIREEGGEVFISLLVIFLAIVFLNCIGFHYAICILSILELSIIWGPMQNSLWSHANIWYASNAWQLTWHSIPIISYLTDSWYGTLKYKIPTCTIFANHLSNMLLMRRPSKQDLYTFDLFHISLSNYCTFVCQIFCFTTCFTRFFRKIFFW